MDPVSLATGGLFFSWLAHDLEELATMPGWTHPLFDSSPSCPRTSDVTAARDEHVYLGIGLMGVLMAVASIDGYRTRGRSPVYQAALYGYGMHTFSHLGSAALARRYTPGGGHGAASRPALLDLREADAASSWGRGAPHRWGNPCLPRSSPARSWAVHT